MRPTRVVSVVGASWILLPVLLFPGILLGESVEKVKEKKPSGEAKPSVTMSAEETWAHFLENNRGTFVVSGEVVDEKGVRLKNVEMVVRWAVPYGTGVTEKESVQTVEGQFRVEVRDASGVDLFFQKEGYHSAKTNFVLLPDEQAEEVLRAKKEGRRPQLKPRFVNAEGVRIVMDRVGEIAHLTRFAGILEYQVGGKGRVVDLDRAPTPDRKDSYMRDASNLHATNELRSACVYCVPDLDSEGQIAFVAKKSPLSGREYFLPAGIRLFISAPNSGFVLGNLGRSEEVKKDMRRAPDGGYQNNILLSTNLLERMVLASVENRCQFFFFRTQNGFGKGKIGVTDLIHKDRSRVRLGIELLLQPDGSRNLETED